MSNFLAVATVTAAVQKLLEDEVAVEVGGTRVTTDRPDTKKTQTAPAINIYLYQVEPNATLRDSDLPTRRSDGSSAQRACAAVDLHYLLTFYGNDAEMEPQRLLGATVRTLHARPIVTRQLISAVVAAAGHATTPRHSDLVTSDLGDAVDVVRICPRPLDLEALSKLWSVFFQTPYALSMTWTASVVLLEESTTPVAAKPVVTPSLSVALLRRPHITSVAMSDGTAPVVAGQVRITGTDLLGDTTTVRVGGVDLAPDPSTSTSASIEVDLAPAVASLRAGPLVLQIVQARLVGTPSQPRGEITSEPMVVGLHPRLSNVTAGAGQVSGSTDVPVRAGQQVALEFLTPSTGATVAIVSAPPVGAETTVVAVTPTGVPAGTYGVSVLVDGAASPLTRDATGTITAPTVRIP